MAEHRLTARVWFRLRPFLLCLVNLFFIFTYSTCLCYRFFAFARPKIYAFTHRQLSVREIEICQPRARFSAIFTVHPSVFGLSTTIRPSFSEYSASLHVVGSALSPVDSRSSFVEDLLRWITVSLLSYTSFYLLWKSLYTWIKTFIAYEDYYTHK